MKNDDTKNNHDDSEVVIENDSPDQSFSDADTLDDSVVAEESQEATIKKLRAKIKQLEAERKEYMDGWQRTKADFVNARKRDEQERLEFRKIANERLIEDLLPTLESFSMAISNKESWEKVDKNWRVGVEYIYNQLSKALEENGLKEINPIGLKFDPNRDEAVSFEPVSNADDDQKIIFVVQKGYDLNGKNMRPPKVKVGEYKK